MVMLRIVVTIGVVLLVVVFRTIGSDKCPSWLAASRCRLRCLELTRYSSAMARMTVPAVVASDVARPVTVGVVGTIGMKFCTEDAICSSCLMPCDKEDSELGNCDRICGDALIKSKSDCDESCEFLANITCPDTFLNVSKWNGTVSCVRADPSTTPQKTLAETSRDNDSGVLEDTNCSNVEEESFKITRVMVSESWETRGIHVRWKIAETHCCGRPWRPPLTIYAIQMRQLVSGLDDDKLDANDWSVLTTTMSKSLNLVNVLTLGLTYKLRIVAVSSLAIRSVSSESGPFKLPKVEEMPVPGAPTNVSFVHAKSGVMSVTLHWNGPAKDSLPMAVSHYLLTVIKETGETSAASSSEQEEEEEEEDILLDVRRHASGQRTCTLMHHCSYKLVNVDPSATYVIWIQAVVQLDEQRFIGEAAVLRVQSILKYPDIHGRSSNPTSSASGARTDAGSQPEPMAVTNLTVQTPSYTNRSLRALVTWNYNNGDRFGAVRRFLLSVQTMSCASSAIQPHSDHQKVAKKNRQKANHTVHVHVTQEPFFELGNLGFECLYEINVVAETAGGFRDPPSQVQFETPPCYRVIDVTLSCPRHAPKDLACEIVSSKVDDIKLWCHWEWDIIGDTCGFLISATPYMLMTNDSGTPRLLHQTVVKDGRKEVSLHGVIPNSKYHVAVRAIGGDDGRLLGPSAQFHFHVPSYYPLRALHVGRISSLQRSTINIGIRQASSATMECLVLSFVCLVLSKECLVFILR